MPGLTHQSIPTRTMTDRQRTPIAFGHSAWIYWWLDVSRGIARARRSPFEVEIEHNFAICVLCATHIIQQSLPTCNDDAYMTPHIGLVMANDVADCSLANGRRVDDLAYVYIVMDSITVCRSVDGSYTFGKEKMEHRIVPVGERLTPNYCVIFGRLIVETPTFGFRPRSRIAVDTARFEYFRARLWDQIGEVNLLGEEVIEGIFRLLTSTLPVTERHINNGIDQLRLRINLMRFTLDDSDHVALREQLAMVKSGWFRLLEKVRFFKLNHYPLVRYVEEGY